MTLLQDPPIARIPGRGIPGFQDQCIKPSNQEPSLGHMNRHSLGAIPRLHDATLEDISLGLNERVFSVYQLVQAYIRRIDEVDKSFNSVIEINTDASNIATGLDAKARFLGKPERLHGIPILLKDNIVTADSMEATSGSEVLVGAKPSHEASVVEKLRSAGAIMLGKASLSEWANLRWTNASSGWSPRGGQCTGPYYRNMKASGSSTGSAVAVAVGLAFAALGTETDGSICNPAGRAGVVGIKPTPGLVARDGVIPVSNRLDTVGPIARNVKDAATILGVIAGKNKRDPLTQRIPFDTIPDYRSECQSKRLDNVRIGVPWKIIGHVQPDEAKAFRKALDALRQAGAEIVEDVEFSAAAQWDMLDPEDIKHLSVADLASSLEKYFSTLKTNPKNIRSLQDLINVTKAIPEEDYPHRNVERFELALDHAYFVSEKYKNVERLRKFIETDGGITSALKSRQLHVLAIPTASSTIVTFASLGGEPIISMPLGVYGPNTPIMTEEKGDLVTLAPGIPFPICFISKRFDEGTLIRVAYAFEQRDTKPNAPKMYAKPRTDLEDVVMEVPKL